MSLHLIIGPMFAGKSTALLERCVADEYGNTLLLKHALDMRFGAGPTELVTHNGQRHAAVAVATVDDIRGAVAQRLREGPTAKSLQLQRVVVQPDRIVRLVGPEPFRLHIYLDEVQFVAGPATKLVDELVAAGHRLVVAGLNLDWQRRPYPAVAELVCVADTVETLRARCKTCDKRAVYSRCLREDLLVAGLLVGGDEVWAAQCSRCWPIHGHGSATDADECKC